MLTQKVKWWLTVVASTTAVYIFYGSIFTPQMIRHWYKQQQEGDFSAKESMMNWLKSLSVVDYFYSKKYPSKGIFDKRTFWHHSVNKPHFHYIHLTENCIDDVEIFIAVCSAPQNKYRRKTIRETWGMDARNNTSFKMVFFEGRSLIPGVQEDIHKESIQYGDIVQEDFIDQYRNLSLKSIAYLRWVNASCKNVKFVLKTDDDMYINIPVLKATIAKEKHSKFIMGNVFEHAKPIRSNKSKWYTPISLYPGDAYPIYVSGTSYVISGNLIADLYAESFHQKLFWLEDVYVTGFLASHVNATIIHSDKFSFEQRSKNGCFYKNSISGHHVSPRNMRKIYKELKNVNIICNQ